MFVENISSNQHEHHAQAGLFSFPQTHTGKCIHRFAGMCGCGRYFHFVGVNTIWKNMHYAKGTIDFNHF